MKAVKYIPSAVHSQQVRQKAFDLFSQGAGYKRVSTAIGVPLYTVRDWERQYKAGKFHAEIPDNVCCYDEDTRTWAVQLRRSGMSWTKFEKTTGISRATCLRWLLEEQNTRARRTEDAPEAASPDTLKKERVKNMKEVTAQALASELHALFAQSPQVTEADAAVGHALRLLTQSLDLQERMHRLRLPDRRERTHERQIRPDGIEGAVEAFDGLTATLRELTGKGVIDSTEAQCIAADARRRIVRTCESLVRAVAR